MKKVPLDSLSQTEAKPEQVSQSLGISGIQVITDHKASVRRRVIWVVLLLLMFSIMTWQVVRRVETYLDNPVAVNTEVTHEKYIKYVLPHSIE